MTTPDELQRAVERLSGGMGKYGFANVYNDDVQLLLTERAELLATVERMRGGMAALLEGVAYHEGRDGRRSYRLWPSFAAAYQQARAALTTGEEK